MRISLPRSSSGWDGHIPATLARVRIQKGTDRTGTRPCGPRGIGRQWPGNRRRVPGTPARDRRERSMSTPDPAGRPGRGLSRRQALAGLGATLIGGAAVRAAGARAAITPARPAGARLTAGLAGLTGLQMAGQRVIGSYPGLTPPASLFTDISNGQVAGVIFFGENISSEAQIAGVITQLRQAQAQSPVQVPLLLMTDQEGGLVRRLPGQPVLSE